MKKTIKSILLLVIFGCLISCEQDENSYNIPKKNTITNPYNYVGIGHNEQLDAFAEYLNGEKYFSLDDIYSFSISKGMHRGDNLSEFKANISENLSMTHDFLFNDTTILDKKINSNIIRSYLTSFGILMRSVVNSESTVTPETFSLKINEIENNILNKLDEDTSCVLEYAVALSSMAIAKYSYKYWYEAMTIPTHPWHNIVINRVNSLHTKEAEPKKGFWRSLLVAAKCVVAAIATVPADVIGAASEADTQIIYDELTNTETRITRLNEEMINAGYEASAGVWEWALE